MGNLCCASRKLKHLEKTTDFSFNGVRRLAKVVDVYDGDTVRVRFRWGAEYPQFSVRLLGIDAPEMKPKHTANGITRTPSDLGREKAEAAKSRDALRDRIGGKIVNVLFSKNDKYGRPLATIWDKNVGTLLVENSVNRWMLEHGAVEYYGGTKTGFSTAKK